jgi:hypothetical protein
MSYYQFQLENIQVKHKRGNISDDDVVTFIIRVNHVDRGHGAATFPGMAASVGGVPASAVPPSHRMNINSSWIVGPLEIFPGDSISVISTGTNISDQQLTSLSTQHQDEIELKILNAVAAALVSEFAGAGGAVGAVSDVVGTALSKIGDPVAKLIGFKPQGPCNGPVFSDVVEFVGGGLDSLSFVPLTPSSLPSVSFTHTRTDADSHDTNLCGHIAETDITIRVYHVTNDISVRKTMQDKFPATFPGPTIKGLREYALPNRPSSIKGLLGILP